MSIKLNHKIIFVTSATLIFSLIISAFVILQSFRNHYTNALLTGAFGVGYSIESILNEMLVLGLPLDSLSGMNDKLKETVTKNPHIAYAGVTDLSGTAIFHNDETLLGRQFTDEAALKASKTLKALWQFYNRFDGKQYYDISIPLFDTQKKHIGAVRLGFETIHVNNQIDKALAQLVAISIVCFIVIALLLNLLLRQFITLPVKKLSDFAQAITHNKFSPEPDISSTDEIGELSYSLTTMRDTIHKQLNELRNFNEVMEKKVIERTDELGKANIKLKKRNQDLNDVLDRERKLSEALRVSEDNFRQLFQRNKAVMLIINPHHGNIIAANSAAEEYYGYSVEQFQKINISDINTMSAEEIACEMQNAKEHKRNNFLFKHKLSTGEVKDVEVHSGLIEWKGEEALYSIIHDITARKTAEEELVRMAHFDTLTGLPNRVLLSDRLQQSMTQVLRHDKKLAVVFLDLDGFKKINDTHGHDVGDKFLYKLTQSMLYVMREVDTLSRLGGDEFVAVLSNLTDEEDCILFIDRLLYVIAKPIEVEQHQLQVTASIGVTFYPQPLSEDSIGAEQLLRQSDQAMYSAKQSGKNRYHIFDTDLDRTVRGHHETIDEIKLAIQNNDFILYYQPKVNIRYGNIIGLEALIRWQHPERGLLTPFHFLPIIENNNVSIQLGEWVMANAVAQIVEWKQKGINISVSVNINALHLQHPGFVERLQTLLSNNPELKPGDLELEILETSALENIEKVSKIILQCEQLGVGFALDDFGTGYSSLTYLKRLPVNLLKIDQSFVRDMLDDTDDMAILEGVIGLAEAFRHDVIAEGVETKLQGEMLIQLGCELAQGYEIAKPMPAKEVENWIKTWKPHSTWLNTTPVSHEKHEILLAIVEHRAWISHLKRYLENKTHLLPSVDTHQCRFGEWLNSEKIENIINGKDEIKEINSLHELIHREASLLIIAKQNNDSDNIEIGIRNIESKQDSLIVHLNKLVNSEFN
ncbi:MAG: EAL domain-containing protein [Gammaproteobacteria bacterium]|nr:EAL domain-containing protein [Gammaproteobacteria bacterium]